MSGEASTDALAVCGIDESGLDPAFDRLARIAAGLTNARVCVIAFGDHSRFLVKGYCGPTDTPRDLVKPPRDLYDALLEERGPPVLFKDEVAGAAIRTPVGTKVGIICARALVPRTTVDDALDALADVARLAETELAMRCERLPSHRTTAILDSMPDACVFLDRNWRYTYVNGKAGEIFDRDPHSLVGKHIWTEFPEGIGQPSYRAYHDAMEQQVPAQIEEYYPPHNRWFRTLIHPSPDGLAIFFQDVTERRRAEDERRRLARIIETTTDLVAMANAEGGLLFLNKAGRALLGIPDDFDLRNLHLVRLHAAGCREVLCDALPFAMENGSWRGEGVLMHTSGAKVPARELILWHPAQAPEGGYFSFLAQDITIQKRAEEQRHKDDEARAQAERMAHLGYFVWDLASNRFTWSREMFQIFGLDESVTAASFEELLSRIHPRDRPRVRETFQAALRDRTSCSIEGRIISLDGHVRHLHAWANVALDDEGQTIQMFGTCQDVTDLMQATQGLRQTEEWLGTALRNNRIAVFERNVRTNEVKLSEGAAEAIGLGPGELETNFEGYLKRVHPEDVPALEQGVRDVLTQGTQVEVEHRIFTSDGQPRWLVARTGPYHGPEGRIDGIIGTIVDVTERHRSEEERKQLEERLRLAQKMEAIGRLAAGVAHDFNNHLTIVQAAVDFLIRSPLLPASLHEHVASIQEAARNAAALTKQMLTFSRQRRGAVQNPPLDLNDVIDSTCNLLRHLLPGNVRLELSLAPALPRVQADREQLERVLLNLVVNARDAMPGGGRITIATRAEEGSAVLEIRDTGGGMTPEIQQRIFEPFFTTKAEGLGTNTGLGLATVYGIVSQSGGSIEVQSEPGAGATFSIRLPPAASVAQPAV